MKKILSAFLCALFTAPGIYAQITLSSSSFSGTFAGTTDTLLNSTTISSYPNLAAATNATWNMAIFAPPGTLGHNVSPAAAFSTAQFADSESSTFAGYFYIFNQERGFASTGYEGYGEHINRQAIHLTPSPPTIGSSDSIIINAQDMVFSSPWTFLSFPATYNTHWSSTFNDSFTFALDLAVLAYVNAPGKVKSYTTETDTIVGWGQMKVNGITSTGGYMHVLQVRKRNITIDSFFINGTAATTVLLGALGLTQGQRTGTYTEDFYRPGEDRPLASVTFSDSTFSTAVAATTLAENFSTDLTAGISNIAANGGTINIYPNPVTNSIIMIDMPGAHGSWTYELINMAGEQAATGDLPTNSNQAQITLPGAITSGIYYIKLKNNSGEVVVKALDIVK